MNSSERTKRYNLVLPETLFSEIENIAKQQHTTVVGVLRLFIKLGLLASNIAESEDSTLLIREGDTTREILFL